ncbi:MAG: Holliday junction resolvase RuvX [Rhodospirillaceae bacterium]|nr:Holliday junction resolvase RuvX [Rhodospirillaceae bacterium]
MTIMDLQQLATVIPREGRLLGFDLGTKTIGLALSDVNRTIASPLLALARGKFSTMADKIESLIHEHGVGGLIIGLPISMDGSEGPRCQSARQFAENMLERRDVPIAFWDERLSTVAVERVLIGELDMTRKRRAEVVDKAAAAYILQGALDALAYASRPA